MAIVRLDKIISDSGLYSRREAKELVRQGRVTVNGAPARSGDDKVDALSAVIYVDGSALNCAKQRYIMLHKPGGVLSATEDSRQETVLSLLTPELRRLGLAPVGRLDKDTTGLLILTNDGDYAHRVISPKKHVPKAYRAAVDGVLDASDIAAFEAGVVLSDGTACLPAQLEIVRPSVCNVTVFEGTYHQVKRMLASRGKHVTALHRFRIGALDLDPSLKPGQWREMDACEAALVFEDIR